MLALKLVPDIYLYDTFKEFNKDFKIGEKDILVTNKWIYEPYIKPLKLNVPVIYQEEYGKGEPSDEMIDNMAKDMRKYDYDRIIAVGGGTIVDICKVMALKNEGKTEDLFTGKVKAEKEKKLVVIPTTCGTGSEVTNVAIAELKRLKIKKGIAEEDTYADIAVLIPEFLQGLPDYVFATSSIDALIHAIESYVSPKATEFSKLFAIKAIKMIINGYVNILKKGNTKEVRKEYLKDFSLASNYAGIAFANAGVGAVHALSYSIGGAFHVPHGEANYQFFTEVFKTYMKKNPSGIIQEVNLELSKILEVKEDRVYEKLEEILDEFIPKKRLREYGMIEKQIEEFTVSTIENQQRLLVNNYVELTKDDMLDIFKVLY